MISTISFPEIFNKITGKCTTVSGQESIEQCLYLLINSAYGEMFGDPKYGSSAVENIFDHNNTILNEILKTKISDSVRLYEPRVTLSESDISITNDENTSIITLNYYMKEEGKYNTYTLSMLTKGDYTSEY